MIFELRNEGVLVIVDCAFTICTDTAVASSVHLIFAYFPLY